MEEILEEEEEEEDCENVYFSTDDLLQVRNSIFLLLKNFLRLLPKFPLKEKPQCVQNCLKVISSNSRNFGPLAQTWGWYRRLCPNSRGCSPAFLKLVPWFDCPQCKSGSGLPAPPLSLMLVPAGHFMFPSEISPGRLSLWTLGPAYVLLQGRYRGLEVRLAFPVLWPQVSKQTCVSYPRRFAKLGFLSLQIFVEMTNFEAVVREFEFSAAMWASSS